MAEGGLFSNDLPLLRAGEGNSRSEEIEQNSSLFDSTENLSNLFNRNSDNETDFDTQTVRETFSKPSVINWLSIYARVPEQVIDELFNKFNLNRENEEVFWLKVYDLLETEQVTEIMGFFSVKRKVRLNLSDNSNELSEDNLINQFNQSSQSMQSNATQTDRENRFAFIHRPNRTYSRMPISSPFQSAVSNYTCSATVTAPNNNSFSTFTSGLQLLHNINLTQAQINNPMPNQSVAQSAQITTASMRGNTNTVFSTVQHPRISNLNINSMSNTGTNAQNFRRFTTQIPLSSGSSARAQTRNLRQTFFQNQNQSNVNQNSSDLLINAL